MDNGSGSGRGAAKWLYLLLIIPFIATLWPPFYNSLTPYWMGIPFFYWYLFLWIIITPMITGAVYFLTRE